MACFLFFFFLIVTVVVLAVAVFGSAPGVRLRRIWPACRRLASERGGVYLPGGWITVHRVTFRHGAAQVLLQIGAARTQPFVQIRISWPDPRFRCEIAPSGIGATPNEPVPMREIPVGEASFDGDFRVRGDNPDQVRRFLSDGVRFQIDQLSRFPRAGAFRVAVDHGVFTVWIAGPLDRFDRLNYFTSLSLELYDQAMLTAAEGIEFVADDTAQPVAEAICPVCGEQIGENMVICRRCKSPHHDDCWNYLGGCSTYGCGETEARRPAAARREQ